MSLRNWLLRVKVNPEGRAGAVGSSHNSQGSDRAPVAGTNVKAQTQTFCCTGWGKSSLKLWTGRCHANSYWWGTVSGVPGRATSSREMPDPGSSGLLGRAVHGTMLGLCQLLWNTLRKLSQRLLRGAIYERYHLCHSAAKPPRSHVWEQNHGPFRGQTGGAHQALEKPFPAPLSLRRPLLTRLVQRPLNGTARREKGQCGAERQEIDSWHIIEKRKSFRNCIFWQVAFPFAPFNCVFPVFLNSCLWISF